MARGGHRPGAGRPRKDAKTPEKDGQEGSQAESGDLIAPTQAYTPLAFMLAVMNDPSQKPGRRDRMAVAAAPFVHERAGDGKKEAKKDAARSASKGKFAASAPPKLSIVS